MQKRLRPTVDLKAQCACGEVSVTVQGEVHSMLLCSCRDCQQATGTGHSSVAMVSAGDVAIVGNVKSHARTADSGAIFTRSFCPNCGTPLFGMSSRAPSVLMVPIGLFGDAGDWFVPSQLIFARSHYDWDIVAADLAQHQSYRNGGAPG